MTSTINPEKAEVKVAFGNFFHSQREKASVWSQLKLFNSETTLHGPTHITAESRHPIER
jgi:hypothetical protein